jgi:S-formylglutathione hydrolase FrmB
MTVEILEFESRALRGNPLGDPHVRRTPVYLPPSYPNGRYPVLYALTGFTGFGEMLIQRGAWSESLPERLDRLIRTNRTTGRRAVFGKSSGGYGAMVLGMRHPKVFHALACHSGDMYFEYCYQSDFPKAVDTLRKHGGLARFLKAWEKMPKRLAGNLHAAVNTIAMAACYSPKGRKIELPFEEETGEIRPSVWKRWKSLDPIEMLDRHAGNLKKLKTVFVDCGTRDQFALHHGARIFAAKARRVGVKVVHEEFDDDHSSISYRYDRSLPLLQRSLQ